MGVRCWTAAKRRCISCVFREKYLLPSQFIARKAFVFVRKHNSSKAIALFSSFLRPFAYSRPLILTQNFNSHFSFPFHFPSVSFRLYRLFLNNFCKQKLSIVLSKNYSSSLRVNGESFFGIYTRRSAIRKRVGNFFRMYCALIAWYFTVYKNFEIFLGLRYQTRISIPGRRST